MVKCARCGNELKPGAIRCINCGQTVEIDQVLDYIVGRNLLKSGLYLENIGTEKIGYFDPFKVVFRRFDKNGNYLKGLYSTDLLCIFGSMRKDDRFMHSISDLGIILQTDVIYPEFIKRMEIVKELPEFIMLSTVAPFFAKYSKQKVVMDKDVAWEVYNNGLLNFLCTDVIPKLNANQHNLEDLKKMTTQSIRLKK
jgi:hypothetical protein